MMASMSMVLKAATMALAVWRSGDDMVGRKRWCGGVVMAIGKNEIWVVELCLGGVRQLHACRRAGVDRFDVQKRSSHNPFG